MTIDILFYSEGELVARVNMCASSFDSKILSVFADDEIEKWIPIINYDDNCVFTDKEFIRRVWNSCIQHGYVNEGFDTLGYFMDKMVIE